MNERAIGVAGLQTHFLELRCQVSDGLLFAGCARPPALEVIRGKDLDVFEHGGRLDDVECGLEPRIGSSTDDRCRQAQQHSCNTADWPSHDFARFENRESIWHGHVPLVAFSQTWKIGVARVFSHQDQMNLMISGKAVHRDRALS